MNERIKKLRKALDLTQKEFATRIGSTQNSLANYESGHRNPSSSVVNNICKEFNVNDAWLQTGNGEMFKPTPSGALDMLAAQYHLSIGAQVAIEKFLSLNSTLRDGIVGYFLEVSAALNNEQSPVSASDPAVPGSLDIDKELELYRQELEAQKKAAEKSSVLGGIKEA